MEAHPDCTLCVHQAYLQDMMTGEGKKYTEIDENGIVSIEKILAEGAIFATSSLFVRRNIHMQMPKLFNAKGFGDHQIIIYNTLQGYCYYFAKPMSVYRFRTEGSWTRKNIQNNQRRIHHNRELMALMQRIDEYTEGRYHSAIEQKIKKTAFAYHLAHGDFLEVRKGKYKEFYSEGWNPSKEALANRMHLMKSKFHSK